MAGVVLAFVLSACSPVEIAFFNQFAGPVEGAPCEQYAGTVRYAGFTEAQTRIALTLMWRESRCDADAHNRSGATGLMQVMPAWADDCGGTPADLYDPQFNVNCALHVYRVQGWEAWSTWSG